MAHRYFSLIFLFVAVLSLKAIGQQANFNASPSVSGCAPLKVDFKTSNDGPYDWDFGNGNALNSTNNAKPSADYVTPGVYTVKLKLSNGSEQTRTITVYKNPIADFSVSPFAGCVPFTPTFSDQSQSGEGALRSWTWVYGDGTTSTSSIGTHTYKTPGAYSVTLIVKNQYNCQNSIIKPSIVNANGPSPKFTINSDAFCGTPASAIFANTTPGGGPFTFTWNFGDGASSTGSDALHTYLQTGKYTVKLTAKDALNCSNSYSKDILVGVEGGVDIQFPSKVCVGQQFSFSRTTDSNVISQSWDFGDGTPTSSSDTPPKSYATAGKYNVTFTALLLGKTCNSVITKQIEVIPDAAPFFDIEGSCTTIIKFKNTSLNSASYSWDFGDKSTSTDKSPSHEYAVAGNYTVSLKVLNELGCGNALPFTKVIYAGPLVASFTPNVEQDCILPSLSGCAPFKIQFNNTSSSSLAYTSSWTFGDGTPKSSLQNPSHIFTRKGKFNITLVVKNSNCASTAKAVVNVANSAPQPKFIFDKTTACSGEDIKFIDQSINADFWCWDFGDGTTGSGKEINHRYRAPGKYSVTLIAKNAGCSNTFTVANAITIKDPLVDFKISKDCLQPYVISLQNLSANYTSLEWDFGDGVKDINVNPAPHTYASTSNYTVKLTATNTTTNCIVTLEQGVTIQEIHADFNVNNQKPCLGEKISFKDKSDFAVSWDWKFENAPPTNKKDTSLVYSDPGKYDVTLRVKNSDGCEDEKKMVDYIEVIDIKGDFDFTANSTCDNLFVDFTDKSVATPPLLSWDWDFGDGQPSSALQDPKNILYTDLGKHTVKLKLSNPDGNCTLIKENAVIFTNPIPDFILNKTGYCIGESIKVVNASNFSNSFDWRFENTITHDFKVSTDTQPKNISFEEGEVSISLKASDEYGCQLTYPQPPQEIKIEITKPTADFIASDETSSVCPPLVTGFTDKSLGNPMKWFWDFGDGQVGYVQNAGTVYLKPGVFNVSLTVTDSNECIDKKTISGLINVGGPSGSYVLSPSNICSGDTINFVGNSINATHHLWDFGDGNVVDTPSMNTTHIYNQATEFNTSLVLIDDNGCKVVADNAIKLKVSSFPEVSFMYHEQYPFSNEIVTLESKSNNADQYQWFLQNVIFDTQKNTTLTFSEPGLYPVKLIASNAAGCSRDTTISIYVQSDLFIPNVFTPNSNDTINNTFEMSQIEYGRWNLKVFNRWGKLIFEQNDYKGLWNGHDTAAGVYYYQVTNQFRSDKIYKGYINILR
jgi:gliding motility-associated-like protein